MTATALVIATLATPAAGAGHLSEREGTAVGETAVSSSGPTQSELERADASRSERCPHARNGLRWYRGRYNDHRERRGASTTWPVGRKPLSCVDAQQLAKVWRGKAWVSRRFTERWFKRLKDDSASAICFVFGSYCSEAIRVAKCESGWSMTPRAHNGQYLGMFQMGTFARSTYGHGSGRLVQARAAYRYFVAAGRDWSPWSCKP